MQDLLYKEAKLTENIFSAWLSYHAVEIDQKFSEHCKYVFFPSMLERRYKCVPKR